MIFFYQKNGQKQKATKDFCYFRNRVFYFLLPIKDSNFYQDQNVYLQMEHSKPLQNHLCKFILFLVPLKIGNFRLPGRFSETRPKDHIIGLSVIWMKAFSKNLVSNSYPNFFLTDYETGVIASVKKFLPGSPHIGCWFHFAQCIYRKIQEVGLQNPYKNDEKLKKIAKKLFALPFLPISDIRTGLEGFDAELQLTTIFFDHPNLSQIFQYLYDTWIYGNIRLEMWNVFDRPITLRTTNKCQSWNLGWGKELQTCNPNFWTVIKKLLREESYSRLEIRRHGRGNPPPSQRRQQIHLNEKILRLKDSYLNASIGVENYWNSIAEICCNF